MSLINDALKQTKQARQPGLPSDPSPLSPVDTGSRGGGHWLVPVVIILLLGGGGVFIGLSLSKHVPLAAKAPLVATAQKVKAVAVAPTIVTNLPAGSNRVVAVPPKPPPPRLQGILFAATRPCAIVSGKTVFVGDHVGQFRVAMISKDSITLQSDTKTNVLSLNPQ